MEWIAKELCVAAVCGGCTAAVMMLPIVVDGRWWNLTLPVIIGGLCGLIVGLVAVAGGSYAIRTAVHWPPRSRNRWRHRFALCSAASVVLLVGGVFAWLVAASAGASGVPDSLIVLGVLGAVSYMFAYALAPARAVEFGAPRSADCRPGMRDRGTGIR
ncbi:putative uncharacterized protein [Rhodococcus sp. AW25M09]|uniref:hypothetical protein n=1 Tax=Rhodococcus sp. AW25M09 TaxID=1268303 RepID=UPI0002AC5E52|nr:hypothetical protein [Rhodococcus sp. AW25M09]CCQ13608.1 putative uncharacterized protein [Rhodococcus sp. AW25M09]